jgi:hypothetical protein
MATKKTTKTAAKPAAKKTATKAAAKPAKGDAKKSAKAPKAPKPPKGEKSDKPTTARHPLARVKERFGSKEDLIKKLVEPLAAEDEDTDVVRDRLLKASNQQLLRLHAAVTTVQEKWGGREKLIAAIGSALNKSKDQDYLAKLGTFSLPRLLELANASARAKSAAKPAAKSA